MFDELDKKINKGNTGVEGEEITSKSDSNSGGINMETIKMSGNSPVNKQNQETAKSIAPPPPALTEFDQRMEKLHEKGQKRGKRFSKIGITVSFLVGLGAMYLGYYLLSDIINITGETQESVARIPEIEKKVEKKSATLIDSWQYCTTDSDCIETQKDCCDCGSGGTQTALNVSYLDKWEKLLSESCIDINCSEITECKAGKVICEQGKCLFTENQLCVEEGQMISTIGIEASGYNDCCGDLVLTESFRLIDNECVLDTDVAICIDCPNDICGPGENECNCPEDCEGDCVGEGEYIDTILEDSFECCLGLVKTMVSPPMDENCVAIIPEGSPGYEPGWACLACGDGNCISEYENKCNCPEDCLDSNTEVDTEEVVAGGELNDSENLDLLEKYETIGGIVENNEILDTDGDGLIDKAEILFNTDINNPDTDGDGYSDGEEVINGYNPAGEGRL